VIGDRIRGDLTWSDHPGAAATDGASRRARRRHHPRRREAMLELNGPTRFGDDGIGHQVMFTLLETEHRAYDWLSPGGEETEDTD
jgi:hypothetical protein